MQNECDASATFYPFSKVGSSPGLARGWGVMQTNHVQLIAA
jgi:hypothetical protein